MEIQNLKQFIKEVKELAKKHQLNIEGVGILNRDFLEFDNSDERMFMSFIKEKNGTKS